MDSQRSVKAKLYSLNHQQRLAHLSDHEFQESAASTLSRSIDIACHLVVQVSFTQGKFS